MSALRFIAIGECMVEIAPAQDGLFSMSYAGDTFNTAWYLRRQLPDAEITYCTATGDDRASKGMIDFITDAGITPATRQIPDRTVGLYSIHTDNGERSFSYWRSHSAAKLLAADPTWLAEQLTTQTHIYFSGITLAILNAQDRPAFLTALQTARKNGATIIFDPNLRPRLWPDTATMCAEITKAAKHADIVLPSFDDEALYFGDADPMATIARYNAPLTVVKNAADRITAKTPDGSIIAHAVTPVENVIDSTAAGDSFNAAFLAAHMQGQKITDAIQAGCDLAAHVVTGKGALVG